MSKKNQNQSAIDAANAAFSDAADALKGKTVAQIEAAPTTATESNDVVKVRISTLLKAFTQMTDKLANGSVQVGKVHLVCKGDAVWASYRVPTPVIDPITKVQAKLPDGKPAVYFQAKAIGHAWIGSGKVEMEPGVDANTACTEMMAQNLPALDKALSQYERAQVIVR